MTLRAMTLAVAVAAAGPASAAATQLALAPGYDRFTDLAAGTVSIRHSEPQGVDRRRLLAVKLDAAGQTVWERVIDADPDALAPLYVEPSGDGGYSGAIAAGYSKGIGSSSEDAFVLRLPAADRTRPNPAFERRSAP